MGSFRLLDISRTPKRRVMYEDNHSINTNHRNYEPKKKRYNKFIHYQDLKKVFKKMRDKYQIDFFVITKIYRYLIVCKDRFCPKHPWDKCRLQGNLTSIRTTRYKCLYRQDFHWSLPCDPLEEESSWKRNHKGDGRWCPCKRLTDTQRELLIMENILERDPNYVIL